MAQTVKNLTGAEMMVSLWPSVEDLSDTYLALQEQGFLATTRDGTGISDSFADVCTRLYDSTNPGAREFLCRSNIQKVGFSLMSPLGKQLNASYFSNGTHNFWIDQADGKINHDTLPSYE